jgi:hypothetical protein
MAIGIMLSCSKNNKKLKSNQAEKDQQHGMFNIKQHQPIDQANK